LALYHRFANFRVGGAIAVGRTDTDWDNRSESESQDLGGILFARYDGNNWFSSLEVFFGKSSVETTRYPGLGLVASAEYTIKWNGAAITFGRLFEAGGFRLTPLLGAAYTSMKFPGLSETGAPGLNYTVGSNTTESFELELGLHVSKEITFQNGRSFIPHLNLGLAYELGDNRMLLETRFADQPGIPAFISQGTDSGKVRALVELGAELEVSDHTNLFFDYRAAFRKRERIHSATLGINFYW
jgi:outer membrane autotransporter protein